MTDRRLAKFIDAAQPLSQASRLLDGLTRTGVHMRGLGNLFKGAVFLAGLLGLSASAFAQRDPQTDVDLANVTVNGKQLTEVTLSRTDLTTYAAYDLTIINNTTNALNRIYFTLTVADNNGDPVDNPAFDQIYASVKSGSGSFDPCTSTPTATGFQLSCTSNISLNPDTEWMQQKVVVVVRTPQSGTQLTVTGSAGGYEGNSTTGQGCCAAPLPTVYTALRDAVNDTVLTFDKYAITFVKADATTTIFTGTKGKTTTADPFATNVEVAPFATDSTKYDIGQIVETLLPGNTGNCKDGKRFSNCYKTEITIPLLSYTAVPVDVPDICTAPSGSTSYLTAVLRIHPSLIRGSANNFDYTAVQVLYDGNPLAPCTTTGTTFPCECTNLRYKYSSSGTGGLITPYTNDLKNVIEIIIKNTKNGFVEFF